MTEKQKKNKIRSYVKDMLKASHKRAIQNIDVALESGAIDLENWDNEYNPMILPKMILTAILEEEARQYSPRGLSFEKQFKKDVNNLKMFL